MSLLPSCHHHHHRQLRMPLPPPSFDSLSVHTPSPPDHLAHKFPKLGETRCYWTLLSSDLRFVYLDPVLTYHLVDEAPLVIGKSVFDFVHPDEQASAKHDLGNVLESRTLHGSVTRMRFSRLSRVRRLLGYDGPPHYWPDGDKIALDRDYMAADLVINWAAEGLVLCFIHAVVDLTPFDNDEHVKTGWSNWCGTPGVDRQEAQVLYQRLYNTTPQSGSMSRVFQILQNQPDRSLMMSWPPELPHGPTARDFARLSEEVQIGNSNIQTGSDAKTSCTRRYKALQTMTSSDGIREVESIFIPHGSIIFACHKVNVHSRNASANPSSIPQANYDAPYLSSNQHPYYESSSNSYSLPPMPSTSSSYSNFMGQSSQQPLSSQYQSQQDWTHASDAPSSQLSYSQWTSSSQPFGSTSQQMRTASYSSQQTQPQQPWSSQSTPYFEASDPLAQQYQRPLSPYSLPAGETTGTSPPTAADAVPPPRATQRRTSPSNARDNYGASGRSSGNPPAGILRCSSCKVTQSPEWRKGPNGKKDLCNACGLRFARSRAKKEGVTAQRRRKEKAMAMAKQEHPPINHAASTPPITVPYSGSLRKSSFDDNSFVSTSPGASTGSRLRLRLRRAASALSIIPPQNQRQHDSRSYSIGSGSFYSSSPLSNPPVQPHGSNSHTPPGGLPRFDSLHSINRLSDPLLGNTLPAASYERERERELLGSLPGTPLSSDPRHTPAGKALVSQ
ncbi:hypothetical protein EVG20_g5732 [Dentipellis fragilis]|uniref:GATA-type domain-containing protein n=1 Tax=Dentipellis fragilis TaxID=205917 RepID=A0A4Y9YV72_9AGAM|nr:hypothetical protein EVG20_g5732 [Dentipellis fragilis]